MNYHIPDDERTIAGPFEHHEDAVAALRDVGFPFRFETGPATVCGDTIIAVEVRG